MATNWKQRGCRLADDAPRMTRGRSGDYGKGKESSSEVDALVEVTLVLLKINCGRIDFNLSNWPCPVVPGLQSKRDDL